MLYGPITLHYQYWALIGTLIPTCFDNPFVSLLICHRRIQEYQWVYALLAGVIAGGGIIPDHLSVLNMDTLTHTVDLRSEDKASSMDTYCTYIYSYKCL